MAAIEKKGFCALCTSTCGVVYSVENDRIVGVRSDPDHPTGQSMCLKGKSAPELLDSPERLTQPLRRTRPKGDPDPGWEPIGWDEALDLVAERLGAIRTESGAETVAFGITTPSGTPMADSAPWVERFVYRFGSPNIVYASELCNWHKEIAHSFTFGRGMPLPDYRRSDVIVLWGFNPANTWLSQANEIAEARKAGAKLIVIDPQETALASGADLWLQVRPGGDAALAMAIAHELIASGKFDAPFVGHWTNAGLLVREDDGRLLRGAGLGLAPGGAAVWWDEAAGCPRLLAPAAPGEGRPVPAGAALRGRFEVPRVDGGAIVCRPVFELYASACADCPPEEAALSCWVSAEQIRAAAAMIGAAGAVSMHSWTGVEQHANATQTMRAMSCLYALTGSFDAEGGNRIFGTLPVRTVNDMGQLDPAQLAKALGRDERPIGPAASGWISTRSLYRAILTGTPYRVRSYISFGANPLLSQADTAMAMDALRALEFHVHCDIFMNPTAAYADIVLPVNTLWEREALRVGFDISPGAAEWVQLRQRMVSRRGDCRSDAEIVFALAARLGMSEEFFGGRLEHGWDAMLEPLGLSVAALRERPEGLRVPLDHPVRKYEQTGFSTYDGLVAVYSETLLVNGHDPLPTHGSSAACDASRAYPYLMTTAKSGYYCHSQQRSLASLRRKAQYPTVRMAPDLAEAHGIRSLDWVEVRTRNGNARFRALIEPKLHPRVVVADYGWWQSCTPLGHEDTPVFGRRSSNYNSLIDTDTVDPVSGGVPMRSFTCDIRREARHGTQPERWHGTRGLVVSRIVSEAPGVKRVYLVAPDGGRLPGYEAGQSIALTFDLGHGRTVSRSYSLIGKGGTTSIGEYVICVRHAWVDQPILADYISASAHVTQALRIGDHVEARTPAGRFLIPALSQRPVVLYAAGIGITPFIAALETAAAKRSDTEFYLLYNNRNRAAHAFRKRLARLSETLPRLRVINFYSRPMIGEVAGRDFDHQGHMGIEHLPPELLARRPLHYLCGGQQMMAGLADALVRANVPLFDIFKETFKAPADAVPAANSCYRVTFARSGQISEWHRTAGTLLELGERSGITMPSGCRVGQCENCVTRVLKGSVVHRDGSIPDEDEFCLSCLALPVSDVVIDI